MPLSIQRLPRALGDLLSIFGGQTPQVLGDQVAGVVELLQFYGLNQLQILDATNAALTAGNNVGLTVPANQYWVLFGAHGVMTIPVGATSLRMNVNLSYNGTQVVLASGEPTWIATGNDYRLPAVMPFPRILLPGYQVRCGLEHLAGAANASVGIAAQVGVLG